jgi:hypothetical protein
MWYREPIVLVIRCNRENSQAFKCILDERHGFGTANENLEMLEIIDRDRTIHNYEKFTVCEYNKMDKCFIVQHNNTPDARFNLLLKLHKNMDVDDRNR